MDFGDRRFDCARVVFDDVRVAARRPVSRHASISDLKAQPAYCRSRREARCEWRAACATPQEVLMVRSVFALASVGVLAWTALAGNGSGREAKGSSITRPVAGKAVHFSTTVIVHSQETTSVGRIQRSTDIVELSGDMKGRVLCHPTSVFDMVNGKLVNTGHQVFSGTILGSAPVMLLDDECRFEVNLGTGAESGKVHLRNSIASPKIACDLVVSGSGVKTPEGNGLVDYTGTCTFNK
jgi:hypothetical protein